MSWHSLLILSATVVCVLGHGRMLAPAGRSSAWRVGFSTATNYDDDALYCGGFYHQYSVNDGKCGVCGDPYDMPTPRDHELGGKYGTGVIVANYEAGDVVSITIELTAYHQGYWEFRLCTDPERNDQECFDQYLLELADGSGTKYYPTGSATYNMDYKLPSGVACDHCVIQWKYTCGNNWGVCDDGTGALGCGNQEQFRACSDVSISGSASAKEDESATDGQSFVDDNEVTLAPEDLEDVPYPCISYVRAFAEARRR